MNTTPEVIEGTWDDILQQAPKLSGHRLRVTILPEPADAAPESGKMLTFGMFRGDFPDLTLEDFKIAEFHGTPDDGLN